MGAQPCHSPALELVQRADLCGREELVGRSGGSGLELGLGGGERADRAPRRIGSQLALALEKGGRRGDAAAALGPIGRPFQLAGDRVVGPDRCLGAMPRSAIGIGLRIGHLGQRTMDLLALAG